MRKIFVHILLIVVLGMLSGCYGYRQVGLLQERQDLPQYDSAAYEPYRLQVNDEIIYRVVTMDETIAKTLPAVPLKLILCCWLNEKSLIYSLAAFQLR